MQRDTHWFTKLSNYLELCEFRAFKWGEFDCVLFAAGAVKAMTGVDLAQGMSGLYSDVTSAAQILRDHGKGTIEATVTDLLGEPQHISTAMRGDIMMYRGCLGINCGAYSRFILGQDETGNIIIPDGACRTALLPIPTTLCDKSWRVPF